MLNFGALIAFMGVNVAAFMRYYFRERGRFVDKYVTPAVAIVVITCFLLSSHLGLAAWLVGGVGLLVLALLSPPMAGFAICFFLWCSLSSKAWIVGSIWMAVGIAFGAWKTRGFRGNLIDFELPAEE